jgi:hypothetical protein
MEDPKVAEAVKQEIFKKMQVTATQIDDSSLATCFAALFYKITITQDAGSGARSPSRAVYMKAAKGFEEVSKPITNEAVPALQSAINPKFVLDSDAAGTAMLTALKAIYSEESRFGKKFEPVVFRKGDTWNFILREFMKEKFAGFVMVTDPQGRITSVSYSLGITK